MVDLSDLNKILDQIADSNAPDSSVSCLQTDFVRIIKTYGERVFEQVDPSLVFEKLATQLTSQVPKIRANTFRCFTLSLPNITHEHVSKLNIDLFLVRAIDTGGGKDGNEALEGVEALKFVYNLAKYGKLPKSILFCLLSLMRATTKENYKKCATAIISCYALSQPSSFIESGGVKCLLEAIAMGGEYQETEVLCQVFMYLFNNVTTRNFVHLRNDVGFLVASLSDPYFILFEKKSENKKECDYVEERETWLNGCKNAILSLCRTWPGLYTIQIVFKEMMSALTRPFPKIQRTVVNCIYDMLNLKLPSNLESFEKALSSIIDWQQNPDWVITEDWVVGEAEAILPPHHIERPNMVEIYHATLLALFLSVDPKLDSVTHVAINGKKEEAILAAILVGELLHLINKYDLISEQHIAHIQPLLVEAVAVHKGFGVESSQCITKLLNHRQRQAQGPFTLMSYQLTLIRERVLKFKKGYYPSYQFRHEERDEHEERQHIRFIENTKVFAEDDPFKWDWKIIASVLELGFFRTQVIDETCIRFLKRVMEPFSNKYILFMVPYYDKVTGLGNSSTYTGVGVALMNLLLEIGCSSIEELKNLIPDFLSNMTVELKKSKVGSGIFSASSLRQSLVSDYFFMIGTLYSDVEGNKYLKNSNIFETYIELFEKSPDKDTIMKCVLVSLLYGKENITDAIFSTILHRGSVNIRVFAIKFLRTLIRTGYQNFEKFILPMLVSQLYAYNTSDAEEIVEEALAVLTEACQDQECLEHLFNMFPALIHLGDKGYELVLRFLSIPRGYKQLTELGFVDNELEKWKRYKCLEYVRKVETTLLEALTGFKRGDPSFRSTEIKFPEYCFTPVHLYGEMSQFDTGIDRLQDVGVFTELDGMLKSSDILDIKAAAWAIGHIGASCYGFAKISQFEWVGKIFNLSSSHENLSVRGTCVYVLNLICKTESGCAAVEQYKFTASRRDFVHHFNICQPNSKKMNSNFASPGSGLPEIVGNRQRSSTLQPPRHKSHAKNRSLGEAQLNFLIQSAGNPQFDSKETQPGEKIGLCISNDIQNFFTIEVDFRRPAFPELNTEKSEDKDVTQMLNLIICLSSTLRASTYCAELEELAKNKKHLFSDFRNYITVHELMSRYKYRQGARRFIHKLFDAAVKSSSAGHVMIKSPSLSSIGSTTSAALS